MNLMTDRAAAFARLGGIALLVLMAAAAPAVAQGLVGNVEVHGFGGWAYGETNRNAYLVGDSEGKYDNANFSLNVSARPVEGLSIVAQIRGEAGSGPDNFELDYAFANYAYSDALNVRIGRVKHPFGIYGEIFDVGTLRPFYTLAQSIYGPNGNTARAYNGVGIAGNVDLTPAWMLQYDVYVGQIEGDYSVAGMFIASASPDPTTVLAPKVDTDFHTDKTIGTRLTVYTPVDGLHFGLSAYTGNDSVDVETELEGKKTERRRDVFLASLEYQTDRLLVRAEGIKANREKSYTVDGAYLEMAYKLTGHWQVAGRWDYRNLDLKTPSLDVSMLPPYFSQLFEHKELSLGINYWFNPNLVVRLSYHRVDGNANTFLETEEQVMQMLMTGELNRRTDLFVFGAQFSF